MMCNHLIEMLIKVAILIFYHIVLLPLFHGFPVVVSGVVGLLRIVNLTHVFVVPIFPIFFLSVSGLDLLDRQLVSDALHSVNSGDELNDPFHIGRTAHFAGQCDDAFFRLGVDAALARRKLISLNLFLLL
jgi:hypothetical protein